MPTLREQAESGELTLRWRTTRGPDVCPDCEPRHDTPHLGGMTLDQWEAVGLPGSGWSVCKGHCQCELLPEGVFEVWPADPLDLSDVMEGTDDVDGDAEEKFRIAGNLRAMDFLLPGSVVVYRGPIGILKGQRATILTIDAILGAVIRFNAVVMVKDEEGKMVPAPEFQEIKVLDFRELVPV